MGVRQFRVTVTTEKEWVPEDVADYLERRLPAGSVLEIAGVEEVLPPTFTETQLEVLRLIDQNLTQVEVGQKLGISPRTAKAHMDTLRAKLGVPKARMLGRVARERGLI